MKTILILFIVFCAYGALTTLVGAPIPTFYLEVIPNELRTTNQFGRVDYQKRANSKSTIPFPDPEPGVHSVRYQQVISAEQFKLMPTQGAWVHRIGLRSACDALGSSVSTNLEIRLSTTQRRPDQLSAQFNENIGPDETLVFGPGKVAIINGVLCASGRVSTLDLILLTRPFFYEPGKGNLLVDIRSPDRILDERGTPFLEAQDIFGDGISRAYAISPTGNPTNEVAQVVDTLGLFMVFDFATGGIEAVVESDQLKMIWRNFPKELRLQTSASLSDARWEDYKGEILGTSFTAGILLPIDGLKGTRYFRLILPEGIK